jgi:hypothetical protein
MKQTSSNSHKTSFKKKRKGVHAKTKHSTHKTSKHYVKVSRGQG